MFYLMIKLLDIGVKKDLIYSSKYLLKNKITKAVF